MTTQVNRELLVAKCDYFVDVQLWPLRTSLDPERWLSNFRDRELDHAIHLLNAFMFFSESLVNEMFVAAFRRLAGFFVATMIPFSHHRRGGGIFLRPSVLPMLLVKFPTPLIVDLHLREKRDSCWAFLKNVFEAPKTQLKSWSVLAHGQ